MGKWLIIGLSIAIVALGGALVAGVMGDESPEAQVPGKPDQATGGPAASGSANRPAVAAKAHDPEAPAAGEPERVKATEAEITEEAVTRFLSGPVIQEIYRQAAGCYQGEDGKFETIEVRYSLRVADGQAEIYDATLVRSAVGNRRLEDCIVQAINEHSWDVSDGFTLDEKGQETEISIQAMRKRYRQANTVHPEDAFPRRVPGQKWP